MKKINSYQNENNKNTNNCSLRPKLTQQFKVLLYQVILGHVASAASYSDPRL